MEDSKCKFLKLSPMIDAKLEVYANALDNVFLDTDLKNIAITGPYCSGKSSMLESYKAINKNLHFVHISLAHFETIKNPDDTPKHNCDADIKAVEGKILNQLIHQIDVKKIPQTHFKIKRPFSQKQTLAISTILTLFIMLIIFILKRDAWSTFVNAMDSDWLRRIFIPTTTDVFVIIAICLCSMIIGSALFCFLRLQHNKNFLRKLSVQGNEIEIFEKDDDSFFDKHLNEVLYLFLKTDADAIVFEDMDRYNSNQIFGKLRELNYLLNHCVNNERTIRFFYLLRDDIFTSKDRTKFFDFIIPIVPVIDGANSYDMFIDYFSNGGILTLFDKNFLQEISMYIDDMRLLKNIYNEYLVYHNRIQLTELNSNKLLAIIAYKNLFPRDFAELQLGKGYVFNLFRNKPAFVQAEIDNMSSRIEDIKTLLTAAENEQLMDIDELDALFFRADGYMYQVSGNFERSFTTRDEFIRAMKNKPNEVYRNDSNGNRNKVNIQNIFETFRSDEKYLRRKEYIEIKTDTQKNILLDDLTQLENRIRIVESANLSEIIQSSKEMASRVFASSYTDEIGTTYKYEDVKQSLYFPLIKYLVRNKYIDENYPDYMSYFYEQSISRIDRIFLRSVFDAEAKSFNYTLKDVALVANRISPRYYSEPEVLNFDLLTYLLKTNSEHLFKLISQLKDKHRIDFVLAFWQTGKEKSQLLHRVNKIWPAIWYEISQVDTVSTEDKNKYLVDTFYYSPLNNIKRMDYNELIKEYISACSSFLAIINPKISHIIEALIFLGVRFKAIDYKASNKDLFNAVYSNNLYCINRYMIYSILENIYNFTNKEDFHRKNYSLIMTRPNEPVVAYIQENMNDYISLVIDICEGSISDDETYAISILNHSNIEKTHKESYIEVLATKIELLESISDLELWPLLLSKHHIPCSKANILTYCFKSEKGFDSALTHYINTSKLEKGLQYNDMYNKYGVEKTLDFYKNVITNNALDNMKYTDLLLGFGRQYPQFTFTNIDNDKIEILIELEIIKMNAANLSFVRENYASCRMVFILRNIREYAQNTIGAENFDVSELKYLLNKKIADKHLFKLLSFTNKPISIVGTRLSDPVKKHILENNFNIDDLPSLVVNYESKSSKIGALLLAICVKKITIIIQKGMRIPISLLIDLIQSTNITDANKAALLASQFQNLTQEQAISCLAMLNMNTLLTVFEGKWPTIEINNANTNILKVMEARKWISSFSEDDNCPGFYRVRARRSIASIDA